MAGFSFHPDFIQATQKHVYMAEMVVVVICHIYMCVERELSKKEKEQQERGGGGNVYKSGSRKNRVREGRPDEMYLTLA